MVLEERFVFGGVLWSWKQVVVLVEHCSPERKLWSWSDIIILSHFTVYSVDCVDG